MTYELRDYQLELIDGIYKSSAKGNKNILIQSPAGSGKTVTMAEIAKRATDKNNNVLFIVHRREIVWQVKETFAANGVNMNMCQVGMVQTITNRLEKTEAPAIVLVDEAHHSLAKTYQRIFDYFPDAYVFGFTATPQLLSGKGLGDFYQDLILGKSVKWLIDNKRLAPFDYYSINLLDEKQLKHSSMGDYTVKSIDQASQRIVYGDVVEHYKELADNTKTIIYTHSVAASRSVAAEFNDWGYQAVQVDGKTSKETREQAMAHFRSGEVNILVNADLYGEGVDVPSCETVILLRPTESLTLFIQQTMRAMRYIPGKKATIIDHVANYTRHGLPDKEHDWSLEGNKRTKNSNNAMSLIDCPHCFGVLDAAKFKENRNICYICGFEIETKNNDNDVKVIDATLQKINGTSLVVDYQKIKLISEYRNKRKKDLKTVEDYYLFAKAKGYKESWIKHQVEEFKKMSWPEFYTKLRTFAKKYSEIFN